MANQKDSEPDPIDKYIGSRMRMRRRMLHLSQNQLGDELGVTFQQVQKYELGTNRISGSTLARAKKVLGVDANFFFPDEVAGTGETPSSRNELMPAFLLTHEGVELAELLPKARPAIRRQFLSLLRAITENSKDVS